MGQEDNTSDKSNLVSSSITVQLMIHFTFDMSPEGCSRCFIKPQLVILRLMDWYGSGAGGILKSFCILDMS
jgi:hypothetical protein